MAHVLHVSFKGTFSVQEACAVFILEGTTLLMDTNSSTDLTGGSDTASLQLFCFHLIQLLTLFPS